MDPLAEDSDWLTQVEAILRRVIARWVPEAAVDDLVQDALERVIAARKRLTPESMVAYSVVVGQSLVAAEHRRTDRRRRLEPGLADLRTPEVPDASVIAAEEHQAIRAALEHLSERDRDALVRHDVAGADLGELAHESGSTPGAVATRLARARARLRVEYVLAVRRVRLPTSESHPVLLALSAGDRRRQRRLAADAHLLTCHPCAELAPALVERRRTLATVLPLGPVLGHLRRWASRHPGP